MKNTIAIGLQNEVLKKSEDKIQQEIYIWFNNTYCLKHHIPRWLIMSVPNGGTRNKLEAIKLSSTGLLAGASDLIIIFNYKLYWVEVKTESGTQSKEQIDFEYRVTQLGYKYFLVRSLTDFQELIKTL